MSSIRKLGWGLRLGETSAVCNVHERSRTACSELEELLEIFQGETGITNDAAHGERIYGIVASLEASARLNWDFDLADLCAL